MRGQDHTPSAVAELAAEPPAAAPLGAAVTAVIPAFNEVGTIGAVLEQLQRHADGLLAEVIVVDDGAGLRWTRRDS